MRHLAPPCVLLATATLTNESERLTLAGTVPATLRCKGIDRLQGRMGR